MIIMHCMIILPLNIATNRTYFSLLHHCIIASVHARKLYLASLFRCFDEADYSPAQDRPYEPTRLHIPREPMGEVAEEQMTGDGRVCTFKNTLRNGLVIAALEKRYDHMVCVVFIIFIILILFFFFIISCNE